MSGVRTFVARSALPVFLVMLAVVCQEAGGRPAAPSPLDKRIVELLIQLGDDKFAVREAAEKALIQMGKPAANRLHKAFTTTKDLEVRQRTRRIIAAVDPGFFRRILLVEAQKRVKAEIATIKGVDAANWGEDIPNPFTNLTPEGKVKLLAEGVDVNRLLKLRAVHITGSYCGANSVTLVNHDPNTIVVLGKGFITHGRVLSVGPVLAVEDAHIMGSLTGADLVWFVEKSFPRFATTGLPLLAGPNTIAPHDNRVKATLIKGDFGWRRPANFLKLPVLKQGAKLPPLRGADALKRKRLRDEIAAKSGEDTARACKPVANPFTNLTEAGKARLRLRGIDPERLAKLKAVFLTGSYCGALSKTFINRDPNTVLVIGKGFVTHGEVYSVGPILAIEDAHFMSALVGADLVWCVDRSFPRARTVGMPVIVAPSASRSQMTPGSADIWHGDYGWRRPEGFVTPGDKTGEQK